MKKLCLLLSLATVSGYSSADFSISPKVRVYNTTNTPIYVEAYYIDSNWDTANGWLSATQNGFSMMNKQAATVQGNSFIDTYSADSQGGINTSATVKWNVYGGDYINNAVSYLFTDNSGGLFQQGYGYASFYHGYNDNYTKAFQFGSNYNFGSCSAIIIADSYAALATNLDFNSCDYTQAEANNQLQFFYGGLAIPTGSYLASCTNAMMNGDYLNATCQNSSGETTTSTLNYSSCNSNSTVSNINGNLECDSPPPASQTPPGGSYSETCVNISYQGGVLSASCDAGPSPAGDGELYNSSTLNYLASCPSNDTVSNINGTLSCD